MKTGSLHSMYGVPNAEYWHEMDPVHYLHIKEALFAKYKMPVAYARAIHENMVGDWYVSLYSGNNGVTVYFPTAADITFVEHCVTLAVVKADDISPPYKTKKRVRTV